MPASQKVHSMVLQQVRQANPREDLRRQRVFAWAVTAVILTGCVSLGAWTGVVATSAKAASTWRRLWRWLNNDHLEVARYYEPFIRRALSAWAGCHVLLAIDTTSLQDRRIVCRVSLIYRGRAVPLAWAAYPTKSHSLPFDAYKLLLERAGELLPAGCTVTLLGDRGFGGVRLMAFCQRRGWHFALRLKRNRVVVDADGRRGKLSTLSALAGGGIRQLSGVRLIGAKRHGVGPLNIHIAKSPAVDAEDWYVVSDRTDTCGVLADYRCRMHIDHSFKDDKSGAFDWEASRLDSPEQVERMLLVMAVAVLYLVSEGTFLVNAGRRAEVDPHTRRGLSYLRLGLRAIHRALTDSRRPHLRLHLDPRHDPDPVCPYGIPFAIFGSFTWLPGPTRPAGV